jgi:very-short-patch-repair endonuclease
LFLSKGIRKVRGRTIRGEKHYFYTTSLRNYSRQHRKNGTKSEACLWKFVLRAKQTGYTFHRQGPVLYYIADFMCKPLKLIIEVDGITHHSDEAKQKDVIRQASLEKHGFTVIRFTDKEVLTDIGSVAEKILLAMKELEEKIKLL